jgi:hypothetical protein
VCAVLFWVCAEVGQFNIKTELSQYNSGKLFGVDFNIFLDHFVSSSFILHLHISVFKKIDFDLFFVICDVGYA